MKELLVNLEVNLGATMAGEDLQIKGAIVVQRVSDQPQAPPMYRWL
jgi:hypothetical protein